MQSYTRADLQVVAQAKFDDAVLLLEHGRYGNAYYLAGYAVEIALKVCAARQFRQDEIPDRRFVNEIYQHDLRNLINLVGLSGPLKARLHSDPEFVESWGQVAQWNSDLRYLSKDRLAAEAIVKAVGDERNGVFTWIRQYW